MIESILRAEVFELFGVEGRSIICLDSVWYAVVREVSFQFLNDGCGVFAAVEWVDFQLPQ